MEAAGHPTGRFFFARSPRLTPPLDLAKLEADDPAVPAASEGAPAAFGFDAAPDDQLGRAPVDGVDDPGIAILGGAPAAGRPGGGAGILLRRRVGPVGPAGVATFEQAISRLGEIVDSLEEGEQPLEESIALFEEGMTLAKSSQEILDRAERRIEELLGVDGQGKPVVREIEPD
jgi:exodeoxyribonuclease VII small subunit